MQFYLFIFNYDFDKGEFALQLSNVVLCHGVIRYGDLYWAAFLNHRLIYEWCVDLRIDLI